MVNLKQRSNPFAMTTTFVELRVLLKPMVSVMRALTDGNAHLASKSAPTRRSYAIARQPGKGVAVRFQAVPNTRKVPDTITCVRGTTANPRGRMWQHRRQMMIPAISQERKVEKVLTIIHKVQLTRTLPNGNANLVN